MEEFEIELKNDFLGEAIDLLQDAEKDFLALEKYPQDKELFRFAHNLKGTSRAVGLGEIAEITLLAENLLLFWIFLTFTSLDLNQNISK